MNEDFILVVNVQVVEVVLSSTLASKGREIRTNEV
jgi:hypothetical protein